MTSAAAISESILYQILYWNTLKSFERNQVLPSVKNVLMSVLSCLRFLYSARSRVSFSDIRASYGTLLVLLEHRLDRADIVLRRSVFISPTRALT
jgi:hypothetical protein